MGQVIQVEEIEAKVHKNRFKKRIVFTNGCFDILHIGHIKYLQQARSIGDVLFLGLNSDNSIKKLKGELRPIQNEKDRAEILAALGCIDFVCLFNEDTPENLIKQVKPDVLVKGGDWPIKQIVGSDFVMSYGGQVQSLQFVEGHSTTDMIKKIASIETSVGGLDSRIIPEPQ